MKIANIEPLFSASASKHWRCNSRPAPEFYTHLLTSIIALPYLHINSIFLKVKVITICIHTYLVEKLTLALSKKSVQCCCPTFRFFMLVQTVLDRFFNLTFSFGDRQTISALLRKLKQQSRDQVPIIPNTILHIFVNIFSEVCTCV